MIRVLFLGTPDFAVRSLESLLESDRCRVVGVVTQPDRPAGRGRKLTPGPVKRLAAGLGLPLLQPGRVRGNEEAHEFARRLRPDVGAVVAFGQILPASFFEIPPFGTLNVHASLLPRYRGAAPVVHALLDGCSRTGVTIMKIDAGMDTGDMLAQQTVDVSPQETAGELSERLARLGGRLLAETIPGWVGGRIEAVEQDDRQASMAPRLSPDQAVLNWKLPAGDVHNRIRAYNPWPGARSRLRDQWVKLWCSRLPGEAGAGGEPGTVLGIEEAGLRVACGEGTSLLLRELQPPNRRRLAARDFVNGWQLQAGERFDAAG